MRTLFGLFAVGFALILAGDARAQEVSVNDNLHPLASVDSQSRRTPMMIVHEPAALPPAPKPAAAVDLSKKLPAAKKPGDKTGDKASEKAVEKSVVAAAAGGASPGSSTQQPIVVPASAVVSYEMASTGNPKYDEFVAQAAARNGVDPNLIVAVMRQESGFNPRARSYKGASGLMQLMPATAARFGVVNMYDPQQNIEGGARYLRFLLDSFDGNVDLVLAGYNAGENAVVNSGFKVPRYRETQNYVRSISARYNAGPKAKTGTKGPVAPAAASFSGGSRFSNNY